MLVFYTFIIGIIFGSFISMASHRLITGDSFLNRSKCPKCSKSLSVSELFPIYSYLIQKGKCKNCNNRISIRYPLIEITTGFLFFLIGMQYQDNLPILVILSSITVGLMIMIVTDFEYFIIPDEIQLYLIFVSFAYSYLENISIIDSLVFAIFSFSLALIIQKLFKYIMKKDGLGYGDVKFFGVAGLYLNIESLSLFFMLSGIMGIVIAKLWVNMGRGKKFPFGPALAISLFICLLYPELANFIYRR